MGYRNIQQWTCNLSTCSWFHVPFVFSQPPQNTCPHCVIVTNAWVNLIKKIDSYGLPLISAEMLSKGMEITRIVRMLWFWPNAISISYGITIIAYCYYILNKVPLSVKWYCFTTLSKISSYLVLNICTVQRYYILWRCYTLSTRVRSSAVQMRTALSPHSKAPRPH